MKLSLVELNKKEIERIKLNKVLGGDDPCKCENPTAMAYVQKPSCQYYYFPNIPFPEIT